MFLTTTGTNVVIAELGITLVHPSTDFAILSQFTPGEIETATSLTTAILAGTLIWRKVAAGADQVAADYDPDYADIANESSALKIYKIPNNISLTGTMAFLDMQVSVVDIGDNATMDDGPFRVASIMSKTFNSRPRGTLTAGQINTVHNVVALISVDADSLGGTIDKYTQFMALEFPDGAMTINNLYGFKQTAPAGTVATNAWGVYIEPQYPNYFAGSVKIGDGADVATTGYSLEVAGAARIETALGEIFKATNSGLSFFGNAAVAQQPSSGPVSAGAVYTATEQTMIQEMYNCLRLYGLLT